MLYDLTGGNLSEVRPTTFRDEQILERDHLQAAIRDHVAVLGDDLLVVAEEFGDFEDARRRIDLLCIDRSARLVVVELKRTDDGGHMELQALRYAAMVSVMTFADLVRTYERHLRASAVEVEPGDVEARLVEWLDDVEGEPVIGREVGIILASANFSQEITTTVLWLNDLYGTDIRCVRLAPYRHEGRLLLDVQQVIPLPEAADLTIRLRRREVAAKEAREEGRDRTKYVVTTKEGSSPPLAKRRAVLAVVRALAAAGVPLAEAAERLPTNALLAVPGQSHGDSLWQALVQKHEFPEGRRIRYFLDEPMFDGQSTWVLTNNGWGRHTEAALQTLLDLADGDIAAEPVI